MTTKIKATDLVGRKLSRSNQMLVMEAYRRGIKFEILPKKNFKMTDELSNSYLIRGGRISNANNTNLSNKVTKFKEVTSRLLRSSGHSAPENVVFHKSELARAWNWAKPLLPVVLKPHDGIMGKLVYVNIKSKREFKRCFNKISSKRENILIEKFIEGDEYRFTYVRNQIVGITNRIPCNVVGDGINTISQLVKFKNIEREERKNPIHKKLKLDKESKRVLQKQKYTFQSIPRKDTRVYLRNNSNISTGGDAIDVTDLISTEAKEVVRKAIRSIPGLRVAGVDVLINENDINILEINTHPMLSIHHYPWEGKEHDVIGKVIDGMFPKTKSSTMIGENMLSKK